MSYYGHDIMVIITFGGTPGSGKGTVGKLLAQRLQLPYFSIGDIKREYAKEHKLNLAELNEKNKNDPDFDNTIDAYQSNLPKKYDSLIVDGKMSFYFFPTSFKIFLRVDVAEAARRLIDAKRDSEKVTSIEEGIKLINSRMEMDDTRYMKFYGVHSYDENNYDITIDTTNLTPEQVLDIIIEYLGEQGVKVAE